MVGITDGETYTIEGSGVMVAPGLVLSATHVLRDHADAIAQRRLSVAIARLQQQRAWLITEQEHFLTITITGANFDAIIYAGRFLFEVADMEMIDGDLRSIEVKWTRPLKPTHRVEPPTRLAASP
jgi:hypothetical protein